MRGPAVQAVTEIHSRARVGAEQAALEADEEGDQA